MKNIHEYIGEGKECSKQRGLRKTLILEKKDQGVQSLTN